MDSDNILDSKRERVATEKGISYQISVTTKHLQNSCRLWEQTLDNYRQSISSGRVDNNAIEVNLTKLSQLKREAEEYQTSLYALGFTDMQNFNQHIQELIENHSGVEALLRKASTRMNSSTSFSNNSTRRSRTSSKASSSASTLSVARAKAAAAKVKLAYIEREQEMKLALNKMKIEHETLKSKCEAEEAISFCEAYCSESATEQVSVSIRSENGGSASTNESQVPSNGLSQHIEQCDSKIASASQMPSCTHSPVSQPSSIPGVSLSTVSCESSMSHTTGQHVQDVVGVPMNTIPIKCGVTDGIPVLNSDVSQSVGQYIPSRTVTSSLPHSNPVSQTHVKYKSSSAPPNFSQGQITKSYSSGNHSKVVSSSDNVYSSSYSNSLLNPMSRPGFVPRVSSVVSRSSCSNCHSVVSSSQDVRNIPMFQSHLVPSGSLGPISSTRVSSNHRPISSSHAFNNYQYNSFVPVPGDYQSSSFNHVPNNYHSGVSNPVSNNYQSSTFTPVSNNYQYNGSAYVSNDRARNSHLVIPSSGPSTDTSIRPLGPHLSAPVFDSSVLNQNQSYIPSHNLTGDASGNLVNTSSIGLSSSSHPSIVYQMAGRPPPEPVKFNGESIWPYPSWRTSFSALVNKAGISLEDKMSYLQTYLEGEALRCIQGSLMFPSEEAYHKAICRLDQRYGDPYAISSAFRSRLDKWGKIASNDGRALRHLR